MTALGQLAPTPQPNFSSPSTAPLAHLRAPPLAQLSPHPGLSGETWAGGGLGVGRSTVLVGNRCQLKETRPKLPLFFAGIFWGLKFKKKKKVYINLFSGLAGRV